MGKVAIYIPADIAERIRGDLESYVLEAVIRSLNLDPGEEISARLSAAKHFLEEAGEYLSRGDAVQASEKLYKAAEECIKVLSQKLKIEEYERAREEGGWWTRLLNKAAERLSTMLKEERILDAWTHAYYLHVEGFHEGRADIESIKLRAPYIEWLLKYAEDTVRSL